MRLFLQFTIAQNPYLLDTESVVAVLAVPLLKDLPGAPAGIVGVLNFQGQPVPVLDLSLLATGRHAAERMSTRLILVHYKSAQIEKRLGLIAEQVTRVQRAELTSFVETGVNQAPWLGGVRPLESGLAQQIKITDLLSPEIRASLFESVEKTGV